MNYTILLIFLLFLPIAFVQADNVCDPGTFSVTEDNVTNCVSCPVGTYQDEMRSTFCKTCPPGTTSGEGTANLSDCVPIAADGVPAMNRWTLLLLITVVLSTAYLLLNKLFLSRK